MCEAQDDQAVESASSVTIKGFRNWWPGRGWSIGFGELGKDRESPLPFLPLAVCVMIWGVGVAC